MREDVRLRFFHLRLVLDPNIILFIYLERKGRDSWLRGFINGIYVKLKPAIQSIETRSQDPTSSLFLTSVGFSRAATALSIATNYTRTSVPHTVDLRACDMFTPSATFPPPATLMMTGAAISQSSTPNLDGRPAAAEPPLPSHADAAPLRKSRAA